MEFFINLNLFFIKGLKNLIYFDSFIKIIKISIINFKP